MNMNNDTLVKILNENDFHLDPLGRIVIVNDELLTTINGAIKTNGIDTQLSNVGCSNAGCG